MAATGKENALWLLEKLVPDSGINNIGIAVQVAGRLREDALSTSVAIMLHRYETLRTVFFATDAELVKEVIPADGLRVDIEPIELGDDPPEKALSAFVGRPFTLAGQALVRIGSAPHPDGDIFCVAVHHLVFDAISIAVFMRAFIGVYEAVVAGRPVPADAGDASGPGDNVLREPPPRPASLAYWRENLRGFVPDGLGLWCGTQPGHRPLMTGDTVTHTLSAQARDALPRLQREVRAPAAAVLLAAYYALLASHGAGPDLVIGSPLDVRGPQSAPVIGYHVNVVPLRLRVDFSESFRQLARRTRDVFLAAMAHADVSVDDMSAELPRASSSGQATLYRHMFNYLPDTTAGELAVDGMAARLLAVDNGFSKFDLELFVVPSRPEVRFRYRDEILTRADVTALLRRYEAILTGAATDADRPVGELAGWSEQDRAVIAAANDTARELDHASALAAIQSRVLAAPQATAIVDRVRTLTYRQLWEEAGAVKDRLSAHGIGAGDVVAVMGPRSRQAVIGAIGVWLAGAAYLPLDAGQDPARADVAVSDWPGPPAAAVVSGTVVRPVPGGPRGAGVPGLACLIDAGQATVPVTHHDIANLVSHFVGELGAGPSDGTLALADFSSFAALLELFLPLCSGGRLIIAPDAARTDGRLLGQLAERHDAGIVPLPPGLPARVLAGAVGALPGLRVLARGEAIPPSLARKILAAGCRLHSVYGAAETAGWAMSGQVRDETDLTSGRPIANTRALVLAPDGRELPIGVRGELCIAGISDDVRHRTGELARWRPDGTIQRLGRLSRQITIAGGQVNLDQVDAVLLDQENVSAAVTVRPDRDAGVLVAFAEVRATESGDGPAGQLAGRLRAACQAQLPPAAAPEQVICVETLPGTADGQIDHEALERLAADWLAARSSRPDRAAAGPLVTELVALWRQLLNTDVTAQTAFFDAGGHSLLAAKLAQDVEELTGIHLELSEIFSHPTPSALAARLAVIAADGPADE
jgi:non-ribosomal peptide synthetase component F